LTSKANLLDGVVEEPDSEVTEVLLDDDLDEVLEKLIDVVQAGLSEVLRVKKQTTTRSSVSCVDCIFSKAVNELTFQGHFERSMRVLLTSKGTFPTSSFVMASAKENAS